MLPNQDSRCLIGLGHALSDLDKIIDYAWCELEDTSREKIEFTSYPRTRALCILCCGEMTELIHHSDLHSPCSANRCAVNSKLELLNAGVVLSFGGCELKENRHGVGTVKLWDAPLAFAASDVSDGVSCLQCKLPFEF